MEISQNNIPLCLSLCSSTVCLSLSHSLHLALTDQIALPDFSAGAMENWGLITYRETALLYDPKMSSNGDKEWVATVIAHELAHMVRRGKSLLINLLKC